MSSERPSLAKRLFNLFQKYPSGSRFTLPYAQEFATALAETTKEPLEDIAQLSLTAVAESADVEEVTTITVQGAAVYEQVFVRVKKKTVAEDLHETCMVIYDSAGSVGIHFNVDDDDDYTVPSLASECDRALEVSSLVTGEEAEEIAAKLIIAIGADSKFSCAAHGSDEKAFIITEAEYTVQAEDPSAGTSPLYVKTQKKGVTLESLVHGKGFCGSDASGSVGVYFDVDNAGVTAPDHVLECDRQIAVTSLTTPITLAGTASALATTLNTDSAFSASASDVVVTVTDAAAGARDPFEDEDTGFSFVETTEGTEATAPAATSVDARLALIEAKVNEIITSLS